MGIWWTLAVCFHRNSAPWFTLLKLSTLSVRLNARGGIKTQAKHELMRAASTPKVWRGASANAHVRGRY